ncbi:hypothetical protein, partial [Variovorax sp. J22R115]|uniref:hypothetical protein n=1 Tax=Variovorax sp. J22R115 TaxID=3053509 RepID=UPI002575C1B3
DRQAGSRGDVRPLRTHAALDVQGQLATQEEILDPYIFRGTHPQRQPPQGVLQQPECDPNDEDHALMVPYPRLAGASSSRMEFLQRTGCLGAAPAKVARRYSPCGSASSPIPAGLEIGETSLPVINERPGLVGQDIKRGCAIVTGMWFGQGNTALVSSAVAELGVPGKRSVDTGRVDLDGHVPASVLEALRWRLSLHGLKTLPADSRIVFSNSFVLLYRCGLRPLL